MVRQCQALPKKACKAVGHIYSPDSLPLALLRLLRRWGLGPMAQKKKQLVAAGKLDKYGRPNEATPKVHTPARLSRFAMLLAAACLPTAKDSR